MKSTPRAIRWHEHAFPLAFAALAVLLLVLTPFWALRWYRTPFLGALLEPNNVVSKIGGNLWPVLTAGAQWPDRLVEIDGQQTANAAAVSARLGQTGFDAVDLTFAREDGSQYQVTITPTRPTVNDLVTLFIIPYLVGLTFLATGIWAYRMRPDLHASRAFLVFVSCVAVVTSTFLDMNSSHHAVILWALSLSATAAATIHLAMVFPQQMPFVQHRPVSAILPWLVPLALAVPTVLAILRPSDPLFYIDTWFWGYGYIAVAMVFFVIMLLVRMLRSDSPMVRQQSRVIFFGGALAFIPMLLMYFGPIVVAGRVPEFRASLYFPPLVFLPLAVTYAIIRYRLLDVDRILSRVLTYLLTTAAALGAFYLLITLFSLVVQETIQPSDPLVIAAYLLLLVLGLMPLRDLIQSAIDRIFYRAPADYRRVLTSLSGSLVVTPDLNRTVQLLEQELQRALAPDKFVIYLFDDDRAVYQPHASTETIELPAHDPLVRLIQASADPLWLPPERDLPPVLTTDPDTYRRLGCAAFVPLRYEGRLIGFMALGQRRSGDPYSSDDLDFLAAIANQSTLALENARLFANLRRTLDQTLEMKNLMDDIFNSIASGVITTDIDRNVTLFNRAAEEILGLPVRQVLGQSLFDALPDLCPDLESAAMQAMERGQTTLGKDVTSHLAERGDLYLRLSCSPLRDAHLGTKGATIVFEDLTERHQLEAEQERIRQTFGRVVAPRVRDRLLADPGNLRLDGTQQEVTILFADLAGFTGYSEHTSPETVFAVLNTYLDLAAQVILEQEGTLDKFMGDAVLALWNAPDPQADHALRAVRAAREILRRCEQAHARFEIPEHRLRFRVGVTTGTAIVGNVGTSQLFNYTAIGDTVNLAQRLQDAAAVGQVLLDESTYRAVESRVYARKLPPLTVAGRTQPVTAFEFDDLAGD